jgi:hypothetical protein
MPTKLLFTAEELAVWRKEIIASEREAAADRAIDKIAQSLYGKTQPWPCTADELKSYILSGQSAIPELRAKYDPPTYAALREERPDAATVYYKHYYPDRPEPLSPRRIYLDARSIYCGTHSDDEPEEVFTIIETGKEHVSGSYHPEYMGKNITELGRSTMLLWDDDAHLDILIEELNKYRKKPATPLQEARDKGERLALELKWISEYANTYSDNEGVEVCGNRARAALAAEGKA